MLRLLALLALAAAIFIRPANDLGAQTAFQAPTTEARTAARIG